MNDPHVLRCAACGGVNRVQVERLADRPVCGRCKDALEPGGGAQAVTADELQRLVSSCPVPVLVDLWAPWCGPCRMVAPVIEAVAREYSGRLVVVKVNTDENPGPLHALGATGIPTLAIYRGGAPAWVQSGALPRPALEAQVRRFV